MEFLVFILPFVVRWLLGNENNKFRTSGCNVFGNMPLYLSFIKQAGKRRFISFPHQVFIRLPRLLASQTENAYRFHWRKTKAIKRTLSYLLSLSRRPCEVNNRVLFTATVSLCASLWSFFSSFEISTSKGRSPPSCSKISLLFNHCGSITLFLKIDTIRVFAWLLAELCLQFFSRVLVKASLPMKQNFSAIRIKTAIACNKEKEFVSVVKTHC